MSFYECWKKSRYPTVIFADRYGGTYAFTARWSRPEARHTLDRHWEQPVGLGTTPEEALLALEESLDAWLAQGDR